MFCFAGLLVVVLFAVNAHEAVICRGNTLITFCMTPSYEIKDRYSAAT